MNEKYYNSEWRLDPGATPCEPDMIIDQLISEGNILLQADQGWQNPGSWQNHNEWEGRETQW